MKNQIFIFLFCVFAICKATNTQGQILIKSDSAYNYSKEVIDEKFFDDWKYILYGENGNCFTRWSELFYRDWNAPNNSETIEDTQFAVFSIFPTGIIFNAGKSYVYAKKIRTNFLSI